MTSPLLKAFGGRVGTQSVNGSLLCSSSCWSLYSKLQSNQIVCLQSLYVVVSAWGVTVTVTKAFTQKSPPSTFSGSTLKSSMGSPAPPITALFKIMRPTAFLDAGMIREIRKRRESKRKSGWSCVRGSVDWSLQPATSWTSWIGNLNQPHRQLELLLTLFAFPF